MIATVEQTRQGQLAVNEAKDRVHRAEQGIPDPDKSSYLVEYEVFSHLNHKFSVTYTNGEGGTEQANDISTDTPKRETGVWVKRFTATKGSFLHISSQNQEDWGYFVVSISIDGNLVRESRGDGAYAIADCSYQIPY